MTAMVLLAEVIDVDVLEDPAPSIGRRRWGRRGSRVQLYDEDRRRDVEIRILVVDTHLEVCVDYEDPNLNISPSVFIIQLYTGTTTTPAATANTRRWIFQHVHINYFGKQDHRRHRLL
uniref:Uncharacterized protein n=1 Tax=Cryptomonas curvata TaxID=233186 RepID=A0A7S0QTK8_9CRYP